MKTSVPSEWRGKVSVLAKTPVEFEDRLPPLYLDIALDGIILYDTEGYMHQRLARLRRVIQEQEVIAVKPTKSGAAGPRLDLALGDVSWP